MKEKSNPGKEGERQEKTYKIEKDESDENECVTCSPKPTSNESKYDDGKGEEEEEEVDTRKSKLLIVLGLCLTIPIVIIEVFYGSYGESNIIDYILIGLASPVQFILGKPFYVGFYMAIRRKRVFTISTLVILSTTTAFIYSIIAIITGQDIRFFEASTSVLTIFTFGEYLESRVLQTTSKAIKKLLELKPKKAVLVRQKNVQNKEEEEELTVNAEEILVGDIIVVRPGEIIAADGKVVYGESSIDESMLTGESIPEDKTIGDKVIGGTINKAILGSKQVVLVAIQYWQI